MLLDRSAPEHEVILVEYGGLARGYRCLGLINHLISIAGGVDEAYNRRSPVANFYGNPVLLSASGKRSD